MRIVDVFLCCHGDSEPEKSGLLGLSESRVETGRGDGRWRRRRKELSADELMAQVEWKGMCLDIRGMIVAPSDDTVPSLWFKNATTEAD